jgi:hypothetical protein
MREMMTHQIHFEGSAAEAGTFRRYARHDGTTQDAAHVRRNGKFIVAPASERGDKSERLNPGELVGLLRDVYGNLTKIQRRTWHKVLHLKSIRDIAIEESVSRTAIYKRLESMQRRNRFCKRWLRRRDLKNQYE